MRRSWLRALAAGCWLAMAPAQVASPETRVIRQEDQRVAEVAFRLATAGLAHCPAPAPALGLVLQHLGQFALADRPTAIRDYRLDRGPGVLAVMPDGPAARVGLEGGDVLLAIDGTPVPAETDLDRPVDQSRARARADAIDDLLDVAAKQGTVTLTVLRGDDSRTIRITPTPACPSRVHLARSWQLNAFADGVHVFLTTRLLAAAEDDNELAFIIAHEMAHNVLGHAALMRAQPAGESRGALTRRLERAADLLAADLMLDAGYSLDTVGKLLRHLDGLAFLELFGDHDSADTRAAAMLAHARARPEQDARP